MPSLSPVNRMCTHLVGDVLMSVFEMVHVLLSRAWSPSMRELTTSFRRRNWRNLECWLASRTKQVSTHVSAVLLSCSETGAALSCCSSRSTKAFAAGCRPYLRCACRHAYGVQRPPVVLKFLRRYTRLIRGRAGSNLVADTHRCTYAWAGRNLGCLQLRCATRRG